jgi:hypothetical protein
MIVAGIGQGAAANWPRSCKRSGLGVIIGGQPLSERSRGSGLRRHPQAASTSTVVVTRRGLPSTGQYTESELPACSGPTTGTPGQEADDTFIRYAGPGR